MIITVKKTETIIQRGEVDKFIAKLKKGTEFSIREGSPGITNNTYERTYNN